VTAAVIGWAILEQGLTALQLAGIVLVFAAIVLGQWRLGR
jgi:probable blue pigment (indigoidine) exporter